MTKATIDKPEVRNFEVEQILSGHPAHQRHDFSFTVDENEFKGHFHEDEITWMHPNPKQILGEEKEAKIESKSVNCWENMGFHSGIDDLEMTQVFEDRPHERRQVTLTVQEHEFKGFFHEGEIHWFHPHPKQKLKDEHVEAIETEIHEKREDRS